MAPKSSVFDFCDQAQARPRPSRRGLRRSQIMPPKKKGKGDEEPVYRGVIPEHGMFKARCWGWESGECRSEGDGTGGRTAVSARAPFR